MHQGAAVEAVVITMDFWSSNFFANSAVRPYAAAYLSASGFAETWSPKSDKTHAQVVFCGFGPCRGDFGGPVVSRSVFG